jgi:hypothetical protein
MVLVGVGTVLALANLVLLLMLLARGRSGTAAGAWVAALGVATAWLAGADVAPLERVVVAFAGAQATAFVVMLVGETTASRAGTRSAPLPLSGPAPPAT